MREWDRFEQLRQFVAAPTQVRFGSGVVGEVGELARGLDAQRVLLVTDPGVLAAGHAERAEQALQDAGLDVAMFSQVRENPDTDDVDAALTAARQQRPDVLVALGGGSALDTAKGANFLLTNGGRMADYRGIGQASKPLLPLIAIPTTAGTGSDMQSFALIADAKTHQKMACGDRKATPAWAVLDPQLTRSMPQRVAACTGIDALAHALESGVCTKRTAHSQALSRLAWELLFSNLTTAVRTPEDEPARGAMLLGAAAAGLAIENSMLGAAHASANPLTAHFGVTHGQAVGVMLPAVVLWNADHADYVALTGRDAVALAEELTELLRTVGLATRLRELRVTEAALPTLAEEAASQWTAGFNPRPLSADDLLALYRATW